MEDPGTDRDRDQEESAERASDSPDLDSMGQDKRRPVVGQQYGASARKQFTVYGIFVAVVIGLAILSLTVVSNIDNAEIPLEDTAPWTQATASQEPPRDIDFGRNGPQNTIPVDEIGKAPPPKTSDKLSGG